MRGVEQKESRQGRVTGHEESSDVINESRRREGKAEERIEGEGNGNGKTSKEDLPQEYRDNEGIKSTKRALRREKEKTTNQRGKGSKEKKKEGGVKYLL